MTYTANARRMQTSNDWVVDIIIDINDQHPTLVYKVHADSKKDAEKVGLKALKAELEALASLLP